MWKKHTIESDTNYILALGELKILVKKSGKEWLIKSDINTDYSGNEFATTQENLPESDCKVIISDKNNGLSILPALPDKPLVIRPEMELKLQPKSSIQLKLQIPVWVQLYHGSIKTENRIHEESTKALSKTWIGEPDNGLLAYALRINPLVQSDEATEGANYASCLMKISNESTSILDFQRLLLHVDQLTIYINQDKLYTNNVHVKFKGENAISDLHYSSNKPEFVENARKISDPRNSEMRSALRRSFYFIKSLTQY